MLVRIHVSQEGCNIYSIWLIRVVLVMISLFICYVSERHSLIVDLSDVHIVIVRPSIVLLFLKIHVSNVCFGASAISSKVTHLSAVIALFSCSWYWWGVVLGWSGRTDHVPWEAVHLGTEVWLILILVLALVLILALTLALTLTLHFDFTFVAVSFFYLCVFTVDS